jgi:type VI secretion system secreted protein VgrG
MATTQANRLMSISSPLGEDFLLINKLTATEGLSELFRFEVELLHEENEAGYEPTIVDIRKILGETVTVSVIARDGVSRNFCGIVANFSQGNRDKRFSYYYATIVPQVWVLTQKVQTRIFQHISVPDILKKIFEGFDVKWEISGDFKPRNYCVQYRESDFDFASRLMEEEGIYYYFSHDSSDKMIVANTPQSHRDCPNKSEIPFITELTQDDEFIGSINEWLTDYRLQSGKVTLWDYNFQLPTNKLNAEQPSRFNVGGNQELEIYEFQAGYARKYDGIDKTGGVNASDLQNIFSEKQTAAEILMQGLDSQYKTGNGIGDCPSLIAGYRFKLINHPYAAQNAQYVLTKVSHECQQSPSYISEHINAQAYQNQFTCIAHGSGMAPFRPPLKTPKPIMRGSVTAIVVGNPNEEIFTDKFGRVKVQFHWDRDGKNNADSSCWIRVAKDSAGNKWGTMYIPRVGQEVIVDFIEGDPDQPIITGSVYNPETMPHYELPKYKTLSYIKTRTSPDDGKGFNELRFEDKATKEQVFIRSQKRMDVRARGSLYETCGGNRQEVIGVRSDNQPGGNLAITVGGNYDLHVKADQFIGIDGKLNEGVKGDVVEDIQGKQQTVVTGTHELNAQEITLEALNKISLKVGGSFITIDLSGVTISGPMVKINSGGAAMGTSPAVIDDPLDAETADTGEPGYLDRPRTGGGRRGRNRRTLNGQHAPPFQTRTLPNGDIQVGNGFIIRNDPNDPTFQQKVLDDMTQMSNHPTGMNTLNSLNNSGHTTAIQHQPIGGNKYKPDNVGDAMPSGTSGNFKDIGPVDGTGNGSDGTVLYNPDNPRTNAQRPRDVGLHHELSHSDHAAHGTYDITTKDSSNNPHLEETNTINTDNDYRNDRGVHTRRDHSEL